MCTAFVAFTLLAASIPAFAAKHQKLTVHLQTTTGQDAGTATFEQRASKLRITLKLHDLPTGVHGVHLHQTPSCQLPDFKSAGGHFNPEMKQHGFQNPEGHHAGDLPQNYELTPDAGTAGRVFDVDYLSMGTGAPNDILANGGTSIVVHEKADDMKTDPSGNSGNRIACGVITATTK